MNKRYYCVYHGGAVDDILMFEIDGHGICCDCLVPMIQENLPDLKYDSVEEFAQAVEKSVQTYLEQEANDVPDDW